MNQTLRKILAYLFCAIVLCSINLFCRYKVSNTLLYYISCFSIILISSYTIFQQKYYLKLYYIAPILYISWAIIGIIRGITVVDSYWVFNQLIHGTFNTLSPIVIFLFSSPILFIDVFRRINIFILILSIILFEWCLPVHNYAFLLIPFYFLYSCFISKVPQKWFWYVLIVVILLGTQLDNRSGVVKVLASLGIWVLFNFHKRIQRIFINIAHWGFYCLAILLLWMGLTGRYNVFDSSYFDDIEPLQTYTFSNGNYFSEGSRSDLSIDTRTFIYVETITSAISLDYVSLGRTPAHGYITEFFAAEGPVEAGRDPSERFYCEVALLNTFNWLGIIGVILLSAVYLQGTALAVYCSKNKYVKCLAVWAAFQWFFSWIENGNQFQLLDLMIYANLAICYSSSFRKMNDQEFLIFFRSLFSSPNSMSIFEKKQILSIIIRYRLLVNKHRTKAL